MNTMKVTFLLLTFFKVQDAFLIVKKDESLLVHYNKEKVIVTKANKRTNRHAIN